MDLEELYPFKRNKPYIIATDDRCKECGGQCCCSGWPMHIGIHPYEFPLGREVESLIKLLKGGFVRFNLRDYSAFIDNSESSSCNCRTSDGCMFPPDMRPEICRTYVPHKSDDQYCRCVDSGEGELYMSALRETRTDIPRFVYHRNLWETVFKDEIDKENLMERFPEHVYLSEDYCEDNDCEECGNC